MNEGYEIPTAARGPFVGARLGGANGAPTPARTVDGEIARLGHLISEWQQVVGGISNAADRVGGSVPQPSNPEGLKQPGLPADLTGKLEYLGREFDLLLYRAKEEIGRLHSNIG